MGKCCPKPISTLILQDVITISSEVIPEIDNLLMETGDNLLLETGDKIELE